MILMANTATASSCQLYDSAIGRQMSEISSKIYHAYVAGRVSSLYFENVRTEMDRKYNNHYQMLFQRAARSNPVDCDAIAVDGLAWIAGVAERVNNELNTRN
jgi:hypothetical protein